MRAVFREIIKERLNNDLLASHYRLGNRVDAYDIWGRKVSREELVAKIVDFLADLSETHPVAAAKAFWSKFSFAGEGRDAGLPREIEAIEAAYGRIYPRTAAVMMVEDILTESNISNGTVVDVGCWSNDFNRAILSYADQAGLVIRKAIGTDITETSTPWDDPRIEFRLQSSTKTLPIENQSADIVFLKWSLHHMTLDEIHAIVREVSRILKPSGKAVLIEALMGKDEALGRGLLTEFGRKDTWPKGPWRSIRKNITERYFQLSLNEQNAVLSLEDYYGHWLEAVRTSMPLPFNYMSSLDIARLNEAVGLSESMTLRRVFGYAPIIHKGPPSIRLVYEK